MKFIFELYRVKSKQQGAKPTNKLIITSNDALHFNYKGKVIKNLRGLSMSKVNDTLGVLKNPIFTKEKPCGVTLKVFFPSKRKSDVDNLQPTLKAIMDGFTDANLWIDDNYETLKYTKYVYGGLSNEKYYILEVSVDSI